MHGSLPHPVTNLADRLAASRWTLPAIVALVVVSRIAMILLLPQRPFSDAEWYLVRAAEMAHGMGYQEAGHPTAFWPVGWPAMLAAGLWLTGGVAGALILLNVTSAALITWLIVWFVERCGGGRLAGRTAALLYAVYPSPLIYAATALSETASTAVAMAAFALIVARPGRWPWLLAGGLLFGTATLMRAQMLLFPAGAAMALALVVPGFRWRDATKAAAIIYAGLALVVLPWTLRNDRLLGAPVLVSTNGGVALVTGAFDGATGDFVDWENGPLWAASGIPYAKRVERQVELDRRFKTMAKSWIAEHPVRWSMLGIKKTAILWAKDSDAFWTLEASYPARNRLWFVLQLANQLFYLLLLAAALPTLWWGSRALIGKRPDAALLLLWCTPAFVTLIAFGFTGQTRYHYPAMPFIAAAAGATLARFVSRRSGSGRRAASP